MYNKTLPYLGGRFFDGISSGMFMMALPWILITESGSGSFVALITLICTLSSFLLTPILSTLIDRHSRKAILVWVQVIQTTTALLVMIAALNQLASPWLLAAAQWIFWITNDVAWSANNAFTQENYSREEYARITGHQEVVMQLTMLGAGGAGIVLLELWSMSEFALFAVVASGLSALCYTLTPYHRKLSRASASIPFSQQLKETGHLFRLQPHFYLFLALSCLSYPMLTYLAKLVPIYFAERGISGMWFASWNVSYGIGALICGLIVAKLLRTVVFERAMLISMMAMSLLLIAMSLYLSPQIMVVLVVIIGFFNSFNRIARITKMNHEIAIAQRGRIDGGLKLFSTLAQSASYVLIALLSHYDLTVYGFLSIALVMLLSTLVMIQLYRRGAHQTNLSTATPQAA
ncbi:MFS transporter [Photobacterium sp. MCCC 1A19761]|uniref:MFS transporter n=1 Tax=Photobacterium sp. MCCC 1A19761 TaxID=3115000 RepID=UPI00307E5552